MADYCKASEKCDLTDQDTSHKNDQYQNMANNDRSILWERISGRKYLTKRQRLAILLVVMLFLGVAFVVLIAVVLTSKHSDKCIPQSCENGIFIDRINSYNYTCECCAVFNGLQYIDICNPNPCQHGRCFNEINKFTCICETGYNGTHCEKNVDECISNTCIHGVCQDGIGGYNCTCFKGYTGLRCEQDVDECISNTCIHGVCQDGIGGYNCTCFKGYTGLKCEQDIDFCSPNPCTHGLCTDGVETYQCECFAGFNGTNCEQESLASKKFWTGPVITDIKTTYVNYSLVSGQDTPSDLSTCAEEFTDNQFLAVRVNEGTGICEGLNWDWGSAPQYVEGYAYLRKTKTVDSYQPMITKNFQWLLPGTFGVGGSVELYISISRDMTWKEFEIMILDKTEKNFRVYDSDPEVIMAYAQILNQNGFASIHFKIWNAGWSNKLYLRKTLVADGNAHKFTFVPQAYVMQIFIDDTKVVEYTHPTDPVTAREIIISPYAIPTVDLHNITFIGV